VRRGRGPAFLRLLAEYGADLNRPGGETWRGDVPLRTPYQHAVLRGRVDVAESLAELGSETTISEEDRAFGAIARGEHPATALPRAFYVDAQEVVIMAALQGHLEVVLETVGPNFSGVVGGSPHGPLLGYAAWVGNADVVRRLLEAGADPDEHAQAEFGSPLAVAAHGSGYAGNRGDYVAVAELLVEAGNRVDPRMLEMAAGRLYDWLEERLR
jgi:ankyrin repeat protein